MISLIVEISILGSLDLKKRVLYKLFVFTTMCVLVWMWYSGKSKTKIENSIDIHLIWNVNKKSTRLELFLYLVKNLAKLVFIIYKDRSKIAIKVPYIMVSL